MHASQRALVWTRLATAVVLGVGSLAACGPGSEVGATAGAGGPAVGDVAPTLEELANATYNGVAAEPVTLNDGLWEGTAFVEGGASRPRVGLADDFVLNGDLDDDDREDAVVLLWESSGGSGTRSYLAAVGRKNGALVNLGTALVGDRVQVKSGFVIDGVVTLDVIRAGPEDAACCPTEKALVAWRVEDGNLVQQASAVTGRLSLEDLGGPTWILTAIGHEHPIQDEPPITIRFADDRVEGSGGCNSYFGTVTGDAPGKLAFSAMGTTMMACPEPVMDLERRYLRTLAGGSSYGFAAGRLVIGCETDDGRLESLFFERRTDRESVETVDP